MPSTTAKPTAAQRKARSVRRTAGTAFYVSAAVTVSANVYASGPHWIGMAIGAWTPLAFFLCLELLERMQVKGRMGWLRNVAIGFIGAIAGWTSYWHLVDVLHAGDVTDPVALYGMPLTVDVLMAVARVAMKHRPASPSRPVRRKATPSNVRQLKAKTA